ncbi:cysteine desulfurase [Clostridium hydrogeniformans]|uniref:cysteine desulfurase n=1 Tax=Clostridium hydrogeniformans TaxID=349933 RepID=UPI0004872CBD|nr:cysteine desulfurase [Clostridium hydrogeniformans]
MLNVSKIREDFDILSQKVNNKPLAYLDNAATTHKPKIVTEAIKSYYDKHNANPHRGAHYLSVMATEAYEGARERVKTFINADKALEVIFTKNATESLNLLAYSYGMNFINEGDEIVISILEHHSNIIPWQNVARSKGAILKFMYIDEDGRIPEEEIKNKITEKTKLVSITHVSNAIGTVNPVEDIVKYAHEKGAVVIVDASQSVPHMKVDVKTLDADFLVFSGHKMLAPMGIGVLYGKEELLEKMPPFLYGGDMIEYVWEQKSTFAELPYKLEAGTQNVEGAVGLHAAIDYLDNLGLDNVKEAEEELASYALEKMKEIPYVKIVGPKDMKDRGAVISFEIEGVHPHDVSTILDNYGVAVRAGHHCAQPLMKYLGINSTSRVSFYFYNTIEEVDQFIEGLKNVRRWLGYES